MTATVNAENLPAAVAGEMGSEAERLAQLRRDRSFLACEVEVANQQTLAAIALARHVDALTGDGESVRVVAVDVVDCWHGLPAAVRAGYDERSGGAGLVCFVDDYRAAVDDAWRAPAGAVDVLGERLEARMCRLSWQIRVAQVQQRQILKLVPDAAWLARFPLDGDRAVPVGAGASCG